jgi:PelA/Pel-15E family pectate lyase
MNLRYPHLAAAALAVIIQIPALAADDAPSIVKRPDAFFTTDAGRHDVDNMLTWQGVGPGNVMAWPKAYPLTQSRQEDAARKLEWDGIATIDNGATYSELRILARAITLNASADDPDGTRAAQLKRWTDAFYQGLDAVLDAQYPNGGWPQRFPPDAPNQMPYAKHITFNDNAMTRLMVELQSITTQSAPYAFVDDAHRQRTAKAFDKGIDCILNCQITLNGKLTGWCAQHDEVTLKPAAGRAYELPSISGQEGAEIALLLIDQPHPSARMKTAIDAAAAWFDAAKIVDKQSISITASDGKKDRVLADAPGHVIWARFYDLQTGQPLFAGRDGQPKTAMADVERERRTGYSWYGNWGEKVAKAYAKWKKREG